MADANSGGNEGLRKIFHPVTTKKVLRILSVTMTVLIMRINKDLLQHL